MEDCTYDMKDDIRFVFCFPSFYEIDTNLYNNVYYKNIRVPIHLPLCMSPYFQLYVQKW
jgi:hypothetical protein